MDPVIKAALESVPALQGREILLESLTGGITNRNFSLRTDEHHFVIRIPGANSALLGIDRNIECASARAAFAAGVGPEVVAFLPATETLVSRFVQGTVLSEQDVRHPATLQALVRSLRVYHQGPGGGGKFCAFETVRRYHHLARKHGVEFPNQLHHALQSLRTIEKLRGVPAQLVSCHNDLLCANFIRNHGQVWIIDWEYAGVGDPFFDLGNLAANNEFSEDDEQLLLESYFGKVVPDDRQCLTLMRLASDMREAMWGFLQIGISKLDFDYRGYAMRHLNRFCERLPACGLD